MLTLYVFLSVLPSFKSSRPAHFESKSYSSFPVLTCPLIYNNDSAVYQANIGIQNGSSTIDYFPMTLNSTTPIVSFAENDININSSVNTTAIMSIYFSDNVVLPNQTVLLQSGKNSNVAFSSNNFQGTLGLELISKNHDSDTQLLTIRKILTELKNMLIINSSSFSLYLGLNPNRSNDSFVSFGGYNSSLLSNDIVYTLKSIFNDSWSFIIFAVEMVYIEQNTAKGHVYSNISATIDLATPNILLPLVMLNMYISMCEKLYISCTLITSQNSLFCLNEYSFITEEYPYFVIFLNNELYLMMDPKKLAYDCETSVNNLKSCFLRLGVSPDNNTIFLGQIFLRHTYSSFSFENNSIGFSLNNLTFSTKKSGTNMLDYTFYLLITFWGMTMVGCGIYFKTYLLRLNIMTNKITKIFYEKLRNTIRGNNQAMEIEDSEESEENEAPNNNMFLMNNNANNLNNANF